MIAWTAKVRPIGSLALAISLGWLAARWILEGGCALTLLFAFVAPYLLSRLAGRWEIIIGPSTNLAVIASAIHQKYLWCLERESDPWVAFSMGLDMFVLVGILLAVVGFIIGYGVQCGRRSTGRMA